MPYSASPPSAWVIRFLPLIRPGGRVLDLAAGGGRHTRLLLDHGFVVRAIDRDASALAPLAGPYCEIWELDLEKGGRSDIGGGYDGIVVTNYLYRPLFPALESALAAGGALIYETFAVGNEAFGPPRNPDFLVRPGELLAAFPALTVIAFEQGEVRRPRPCVVERLAAVRGPIGRLPEAAGLDSAAKEV
jgi:SAM-dependent methyltransferase